MCRLVTANKTRDSFPKTVPWFSSIQNQPSLKLDLTMHILGLCLRLAQSCVELHYGTVIKRLILTQFPAQPRHSQ